MEREYNKKRYSARSEQNERRYSRETEDNRNRKPVIKKRRESNDGNRYDGNRNSETSERRSFGKREYRSEDRQQAYRDRPVRNENNHERRPSYRDNNRRPEGENQERRVFKRRITSETGNSYGNNERDRNAGENRRWTDRGERRNDQGRKSDSAAYSRERRPISKEEKENLKLRHYSKKKILSHRLKQADENSELRLNRYISMGGVCSRRDADELIVAGRVKVNGEVVQTVGMKVRRNDQVEVDDVVIYPEKKVYLVLNKPKDYVTTVEDPLERKTVMSLVEGACKERIYPVGRLDRQTTGVLLFTNDGDLAKKLTHPKYDHKKIYHVFLDKALEEKDLEIIAGGVELEDGFIKADEINYVAPDRTEVGIEIHSGKNRIVRRIFEHLGYQIIKLDRVYFAGITKKNIPRGKWRFLTSREVNMLKVY